MSYFSLWRSTTFFSWIVYWMVLLKIMWFLWCMKCGGLVQNEQWALAGLFQILSQLRCLIKNNIPQLNKYTLQYFLPSFMAHFWLHFFMEVNMERTLSIKLKTHLLRQLFNCMLSPFQISWYCDLVPMKNRCASLNCNLFQLIFEQTTCYESLGLSQSSLTLGHCLWCG